LTGVAMAVPEGVSAERPAAVTLRELLSLYVFHYHGREGF
jgi:hypothetical protein